MRTDYRTVRPLIALLALSACDGPTLDAYPAPTVAPPEHRPSGCVGGLAKTHVTIPFGGGLQGDVDPKLLAIGRLITGTNIRQLRQGEWIARPGTTALSTALLGSADTLPAPWALATLKDCLTSLSVVGDHPANAYSPTAGQWATDGGPNTAFQASRRGPIVATRRRISPLGRGPDVVYASGYYFATSWAATASGIVFYQEGIDATTGRKVFERQVPSTVLAARTIGVVVVNGYAVFVRDSDAAAADVVFDYWQISNLDAGPSSSTVAVTVGINAPSEADVRVKDATTIQVAYVDNVGNVQGIDFTPSTATIAPWTLNDATAAAVPVDLAMSWMTDPGGSGKIALITASAAQGVRVQWNIPTVGATRQAGNTYTINAAPPTPMGNVTGHTRGSSATGEFTVLYDNTNGASSLIRQGTRTAGVIADAVLYRSVAITSKTWQQGSDYYVLARHPSFLQATQFVLRVPFAGQPAPLAAVALNVGIDNQIEQRCSVSQVSPGVFVTGITVRERLSGNPSAYVPTDMGVELVTIKYATAGDTTLGVPHEAIDNLLVPGGALGQFDGTTYAEAGFAYYPEQPTLTPNAAGANTYWYVDVYAYPDASGRLWRSSPSLPKSVTTNVAIGGGGQVTIGSATLRIAGRAGVIIEHYRTAAGAASTGTYQKVGVTANDTAVDSVSFVDTVTDASQAFGEFLYTNGGVLANDAIPGFVATAVANGRLFGISADDSSKIWVSNEFVDGLGLVFSEDNVITIRDQHGALTALSAQPNGIVLAYKAGAVYAIGGAGPDAAGNGGFSVQAVSIGLGTTNPRSIVEGSFGAEFKSTSSRAGWYRIGLGLTPEYIGGPVQAYVGETVVGAVLVPALSETRYYTATAMVLVHNLVTDVWSVDQLSYGSVTAATAYNGGAAFSAGGTVFVDLPGSIADNGSAYDLTLETPWIKMADLKGYQHFYRIQGVGENASPGHTVTVALFKDFDDVGGLGTPRAVTPGVLWDWERRYAAKLHALKVRLTITTGGAAPGPKMSALVIEYGVKQGMGRLATSKRTT